MYDRFVGLLDFFKKRVPAPPRSRIPLSPELRGELEKTRRSFIRIALDREVVDLAPTTSKLGGVPYRPVGSLAPAPDRFLFLAQINFAELPALAEMPLPTSGIVQFWIDDDDTHGLYGADGRERTDGHRVVYYASVDAPQQTGVVSHYGRGPLSFDDPRGHRMRFELDSEIVGLGDYAAEALRQRLPELESELNDYDAAGHKIGGYCSFTQYDPRRHDDPMLSLLQLDGDAMLGWGDSGIAHWFIREDDLRGRNFAATTYYWDCC